MPRFPATSAPLSPNSQRRQSFHVHFPVHTGRSGRGSRGKFLHFASPSPRLPGLSSVAQAGLCGHHISLRRRRGGGVPEPPPPPRARRVGRVFLPGPRPSGRGPRASCVAAQTRLVGAAHAAADQGVRATQGPAPERPTHVHTHAHTRTRSRRRPGRRSWRAAPLQPRASARGRACGGAACAPGRHCLHAAWDPSAAAPARAAPRRVQASAADLAASLTRSCPSSSIDCPLSAAGRSLRSPPRLQQPARTPRF